MLLVVKTIWIFYCTHPLPTYVTVVTVVTVTQPLHTKVTQPHHTKNHATSQQQQKSCNLSTKTKKIMQPLKKIMQPLHKTKITKPLHKKNCNFYTQKNHVTSQK